MEAAFESRLHYFIHKYHDAKQDSDVHLTKRPKQPTNLWKSYGSSRVPVVAYLSASTTVPVGKSSSALYACAGKHYIPDYSYRTCTNTNRSLRSLPTGSLLYR
jgi:hypothetical protein